jgi:putative transposase
MIQFIRPGTPNQNAYIERFNRINREDVLDRYLFGRLQDIREATWHFLRLQQEPTP